MTDLFGEESLPENKRPDMRLAEAQHKTLVALYGAKGGQKCKDCVHFIRKYGGKYFKCNLARQSHSEASDWRANWVACGRFEKAIK